MGFFDTFLGATAALQFNKHLNKLDEEWQERAQKAQEFLQWTSEHDHNTFDKILQYKALKPTSKQLIKHIEMQQSIVTNQQARIEAQATLQNFHEQQALVQEHRNPRLATTPIPSTSPKTKAIIFISVLIFSIIGIAVVALL